MIQQICTRIQTFIVQKLTNLDLDQYKCDPGAKKLEYLVSVAANKTIQQIWLQSQTPLIKIFLEKL